MMILLAIAVTIMIGRVSGQIGLCPQPSGDFPNPSSERCTTFFRCVQGQPNLLRCPVNQRFDFLFRICRPRGQVDCNNQLQIFATPTSRGVSASIGGKGSDLGGLVGALGGDLGGSLGAGGIGVGLPQAGLLNFILGRAGTGVDGGNGNQLALIAALAQMMGPSPRRATPVSQTVQQQLTPEGFDRPVISLLGGNNPSLGPSLGSNSGGFGVGVNYPQTPYIRPQVPSIASLVGQPNIANGHLAQPPLNFNPGQLQQLVDLAATTAHEKVINNDDDNKKEDNNTNNK